VLWAACGLATAELIAVRLVYFAPSEPEPPWDEDLTVSDADGM
jgi:hypothetical protein